MMPICVHDEAVQAVALLPGHGAVSEQVPGIPSHSSDGFVTDQSWRGAGGVSAVTQWECDSTTATLCLISGPICQSSAGSFSLA